jgi:hypothetical protein
MGGIADQLLQMKKGSVGDLYTKLQIMMIQERYDEVEEHLPELSQMSQPHYAELNRKLKPHLTPLKVTNLCYTSCLF